MIIDGNKISKEIIWGLETKKPLPFGLAAILIGGDKSSESFLLQKEKLAKVLKISFQIFRFKDTDSQLIIEEKIKELNADPKIGGIILQLPLPKAFNQQVLIEKLSNFKDIDNLKDGGVFESPSVLTIKEILSRISFNIKNRVVAIVGLGFLVGRPIAKWLAGEVAGPKNVLLFDKDNFDKNLLKGADLVISGAGVSKLITGEFIKEGAVLIDFGYSYIDGRVFGDFDFESCEFKSKYITPTPGGTGPILIPELFSNLYKSAKL